MRILCHFPKLVERDHIYGITAIDLVLLLCDKRVQAGLAHGPREHLQKQWELVEILRANRVDGDLQRSA